MLFAQKLTQNCYFECIPHNYISQCVKKTYFFDFFETFFKKYLYKGFLM